MTIVNVGARASSCTETGQTGPEAQGDSQIASLDASGVADQAHGQDGQHHPGHNHSSPSHASHSHAGHHHNHDLKLERPARVALTPGFSLMRVSLGERMLLAAALSALLWVAIAGVLWA